MKDDEERPAESDLYPGKPEKGKVTYTFTKSFFIEESDFSAEHVDKYYGLTPTQSVRLFNGPFMKYKDIVKKADGTIDHIVVEVVDNPEKKVKGCIHWVSEKYSMDVKVNLYGRLFEVENPKSDGKDWIKSVNPESLVVKSGSKMWSHLSDIKPYDRFQFLRKGYFTVSDETTDDVKVLNCTVTLVESNDAKKLK
jgi:glutaminyl-tRNA synthetase